MPVPTQYVDQNPWWRSEKAIDGDNRLVQFDSSTIQWQPRLKFYLKFSDDVVYTLRGPRQIGKTTLVKILIRDLFKNLWKTPDQVFYYSCDLVGDPRQLKQIISDYIDGVRLDSQKRLFIFLDEVSSIKDWQKAIKHLADLGKLNNCTLLLTGSHSIDVKKASENLTGRRGNLPGNLDKILLPMKFSEYVECRNIELRNKILSTRIRFRQERQSCLKKIMQGEIPKEVNEFALYSRELELLFRDYMITGGIPKVINDYVKAPVIPDNSYKVYVDAVLGDITRWDKKEIYLRQVVVRIMETIGSSVSWSSLRNNTDISSHETVASYVDLLESAFVISTIYRLNQLKDAPDFAKDKKIYFLDPFFHHAMHAWSSGKKPFDLTQQLLQDSQKVGALVEGIVANHLIRCAFGFAEQKEFFEYTNQLFYWRSDKQREVDFVMKMVGNSYHPIEVKYQNQISRDDKQGIFDFQKAANSTSGLILSNGPLSSSEKIVVMPVWIYLLLI